MDSEPAEGETAATAYQTPGRGFVALLAVACGISVATNYYAQPLLAEIGRTLGTSGAVAATLVTIAQIGVAGGIVLLVPLGDRLNRRGLVPVMLILTATGMVVCVVAQNFAQMIIGATVASLFSVVAQVIVPYAAGLASEQDRGRVLGRVMSGLLMGILLARSVAGVIAEFGGGYRVVYAVAAVAVLFLAVALRRTIRDSTSDSDLSYLALLTSTAVLLRDEPMLRVRAVYGALTFAGFGALWTTLALLLSAPPFSYGEAAIGLVSLFGAVGAFMARKAGTLVDKGWLYPITGIFLAVELIGWGFGLWGTSLLVPLLVSLVLIDLGVQGVHISNQTAVYRRRPSARSRLTTVYMASYFLGGALGSAAASVMYASIGWSGVCMLGAAITGVALLFWLGEIATRHSFRDPESHGR